MRDGVRYSLIGRTVDGKGIYKTNYSKNTPKPVKQSDLITVVRNVWSNNPITLEIVEEGTPQTITANCIWLYMACRIKNRLINIKHGLHPMAWFNIVLKQKGLPTL